MAEIQGFFLNSTHFDWTSHEINYGEAISRLTGGKHFVINTAENGRGPLVPHNRVKHGNEVLCNPPNRGLGPKPTFDTGYRERRTRSPGSPTRQVRRAVPCRARRRPDISGPSWPLDLVRHADFAVH